ncbi:MAG: hypothetical protein ACKV19_23435, partial [Verrucomicrobiales bacterium]
MENRDRHRNTVTATPSDTSVTTSGSVASPPAPDDPAHPHPVPTHRPPAANTAAHTQSLVLDRVMNRLI